jgi:Macrocin-O-methyltransferase (TylF)
VSEEDLRRMYLDLLKASVRNELYRRVPEPSVTDMAQMGLLWAKLRWKYRHDDQRFASGGPRALHSVIQSNRPDADTIVSRAAADNVQFCVENVVTSGIEGDLIEAGVFRGGVAILMRGILAAWGVEDRTVYCADSWEGLPEPGEDLADAVAHDVLKSIDHFSVSLKTVKEAFARYGLLDDHVVFLKGWFAETLPAAPFQKLAVVRLDGDYYQSTIDAISVLYPKLQPGGWLIVDDYGLPLGARRATDRYRSQNDITDRIFMADKQVAYWQKSASAGRSGCQRDAGCQPSDV